MGSREAGELASRYRKQANLTQEFVAHELSETLGRKIDQTTVSKHMRGQGWTFDLVPAYAKILGIPSEEMAAAWGLDIGARRPRPTTLADVVKSDPSLSNAAKKHLLNQYELLQMASRQERQGKPVLNRSALPTARSARKSG